MLGVLLWQKIQGGLPEHTKYKWIKCCICYKKKFLKNLTPTILFILFLLYYLYIYVIYKLME